MAKIGIVLSGCGVFDGAETSETAFTALTVDRLGHDIIYMAPNKEQSHVINHLTGEETGETRNVLVESARIARGKIEDIASVTADQLDALLLPGGFGGAKNLCDFAARGAECKVDTETARLVRMMYETGKPIGFICITPVIAAMVFGMEGVEVTIGNDADTAAAIEKTGAKHVEKSVTEIHVDSAHKIVSTPAYMLGQRPSEVAEGIEKLVNAVCDMLD